jgi:ribosomal protein S18 acetylase RimI-like enzyme
MNFENQLRDVTFSRGTVANAAELSDPSVTTILGHSSGELVAYAQIRRSSPPSCVTHDDPIELHRLYVDRNAHGSGLASKLVQAVHQAAHEFEGRHIWLGVWEQNARAISFYMKVGFADVGSTIFMVGPDEQVDRVLVTGVRLDRELLSATDPKRTLANLRSKALE